MRKLDGLWLATGSGTKTDGCHELAIVASGKVACRPENSATLHAEFGRELIVLVNQKLYTSDVTTLTNRLVFPGPARLATGMSDLTRFDICSKAL